MTTRPAGAQTSGATTDIDPGWLYRLGHNARFWIVPEFKIVYSSVAKNACTSLKWVMAELGREDLSTFTAGIKPYINDDHSVHTRGFYRNVLFPDEVGEDLARDIHPDNGWFVFGVVRDPRVRFFSAWQDKLLMQDPAYRAHRNAPWYPHIPRDTEDIVRQFATFTDVLIADTEFRLRRDTHFRGQVGTLEPDKVPYSRIYPIERLGELHRDLTEHVRALGWTAPVEFRRSNDTPLRANAAAITPDIRAKLEHLYAPDFERFGEFWTFDKIAATPEWTPQEIREVQLRGVFGQRLSDMRRIALERQAEAAQAVTRAREANTRAAGYSVRASEAEEKTAKVRAKLKQAQADLHDLRAERQRPKANRLLQIAIRTARRFAGRGKRRLLRAISRS